MTGPELCSCAYRAEGMCEASRKGCCAGSSCGTTVMSAAIDHGRDEESMRPPLMSCWHISAVVRSRCP
eukprot:scaffold3367_cov165-Alexandrium_tamarense.AAC.4